MDLTLPKLSQDQADDLMSPMELDLMAFFSVLQDDLLRVIEENKDKSVDDIIHAINSFL